MLNEQTSLTNDLLGHLKINNRLNSYEYSVEHAINHQKIIGVLKSLSTIDKNFLVIARKSFKKISLTAHGQSFVDDGSCEYRVWKSVPDDGIELNALKTLYSDANFGFDKAMQNGWIAIDDQSKLVFKSKQDVLDGSAYLLKAIELDPQNAKPDEMKELVKRKLLTQTTINYFVCKKGSTFTTELVQKAENDLTEELIVSGKWRELNFKRYNLDAKGVEPQGIGVLHPLLRMRSCIRDIFLELGFEEMPTNRYVESSFWNFDALFQPQEHPARDQQDTFFVSEPRQSAQDWPGWYEDLVKRVHSAGAYGSTGYQSEWKIEEAKKNILRTHTTAVSARMLFKLAQQKPFKPAKYFSIDRVYRNESVDATHLAEFHQVEGLVADYDLNLGHLIGIIKQFYSRIGLLNLKFKPAYNPYTEPSMEVFCFHQGLNKLIEVGNSGLFRPEMLLPMGLPENVRVIAWGLSLERPTMIKFGISNIRELVGHRIDLQMYTKFVSSNI